MVKNQPNQVAGGQLTSVADGSDYVGVVTVYITIDAGTQTIGSVGGGICQAEGRGYYTYRPSQAETNGTNIAFTFTGSGAISATVQYATVTETSVAAVEAATATLAYTVRTISTNALIELGVLEPGETMSAVQGQQCLRRVQSMIDSWAAQRLTLSLQLRTSFVWPASTSTVQVGPGQTVDMVRPVWIDTINYVIPGTNPGVEVQIGLMDEDAFAALTIKSLPSALPQQAFYQTNLADQNGSLFLWPQPQSLTIVLYTPQAVSVPATLDSVLQGPPGYQDAFHYQLALRLCAPFGVAVPQTLPRMAMNAWNTMTAPNVSPGAMGIDPALAPGLGAGYNVFSDSTTFGSR